MRQKIPANISADHILLAINELDKNGVPEEHQSTKFDLIYNGKIYPPKYVIRTANIFANGEPFETKLFSGGDEANAFLEKLGFEIQQKTFSWTIININVAVKKMDKSSFMHHGTGIPIDIRDYFELHDIEKGYQCPVNLVYQDRIYQAVISADNQPNPRTRLMWREDFASVIRAIMPTWYQYFSSNSDSSESPEMRFIKTGQPNEYKIEFIDPKDVQNDIDEDIDYTKEQTLLKEGKIQNYYGKRYERVPENRKRAIEIHGLTCSICGFDFEKVYGLRGHGFIEIHHINPLSSFEDEQTVNPETDLLPVCSNCHRIIHRIRENVLSIEEMKIILQK